MMYHVFYIDFIALTNISKYFIKYIKERMIQQDFRNAASSNDNVSVLPIKSLRIDHLSRA